MKFRYNKYNHTTTVNCGEVSYSILWPYLGSQLSCLVWNKDRSNLELVALDEQDIKGVK